MIKVKGPTAEVPLEGISGTSTESVAAQEYDCDKTKFCGFDGDLIIICIEAAQDVEDAILADARFAVVE